MTVVEQKNRILRQVGVDRECDVIFGTKLAVENGPAGFVERIGWLADHYERDAKILSRPAPVCGGCEFKATPEEEAKGLKSGFKECWKAALKWKLSPAGMVNDTLGTSFAPGGGPVGLSARKP